MLLNEFQNRFPFTLKQVYTLYDDMNRVVFQNQLSAPRIIIEDDLQHMVAPAHADLTKDGDVLGYCDQDPSDDNCVILLSAAITDASTLMEVLVHEMVHKHIVERSDYQTMLKVGHGREFMKYASYVRQYRGLKLHGAVFDVTINSN